MIVLPRESSGSAIAVFTSDAIPARSDSGATDVVVRQLAKDDAASSSEAAVTALHQDKSVLINLGPSESLLSNLSDDIHFSIDAGGARWVDLDMKDGHAARDSLRECLERR